jgi:hypothetical protein
MQMKTVSSRAISSIGYDPQTCVLKIQFKQGRTYDFCGVPQHVFDGLLNAGSHGGYYNDHIRDRYHC